MRKGCDGCSYKHTLSTPPPIPPLRLHRTDPSVARDREVVFRRHRDRLGMEDDRHRSDARCEGRGNSCEAARAMPRPRVRPPSRPGETAVGFLYVAVAARAVAACVQLLRRMGKVQRVLLSVFVCVCVLSFDAASCQVGGAVAVKHGVTPPGPAIDIYYAPCVGVLCSRRVVGVYFVNISPNYYYPSTCRPAFLPNRARRQQ